MHPRVQVIIVVASLTKDMNAAEDLCKANAIRVLCKIIDVRARARMCRPATNASHAAGHHAGPD